PDGQWRAASGLGMFRTGASAREAGRVFPYRPSQDSEMLQDRAAIYLFNLRTKAVRLLRSHTGNVVGLTFAPRHPDKPPLLVSAAQEPVPGTRKTVGRVCL